MQSIGCSADLNITNKTHALCVCLFLFAFAMFFIRAGMLLKSWRLGTLSKRLPEAMRWTIYEAVGKHEDPNRMRLYDFLSS